MLDLEGEKLLARRLQANLRNAEELKRQIAEKKRPIKSPAPYSTTTGDSYAIRKPGGAIPSKTYEGYDVKGMKKRVPFAVESPSKTMRNPKSTATRAPRPQRMSVTSEIPAVLQVPDLPTVSIPSSNFSAFESSLPIAPSMSKSFDCEDFPRRLKHIETIAADEEKLLKQLAKRVKKLSGDGFADSVAELRTSVDDVLVRTRVMTNSFSESLSVSEQMLKKSNESIRSVSQSVVEKNIELAGTMQMFDGKLKDADFGTEKLRNEVRRMGDRISELGMKIGKVEEKEILIHTAGEDLFKSCFSNRAKMQRPT